MRGLVAFWGVLVLCMSAVAQWGGWVTVQGITSGSRVEVRLAGATVKGTLVGVSKSSMEIQTSGGSIHHLDKEQVEKVYLVGRSHKLRDGLIGAGIGFAGGFISDYAKTQKYQSVPGGQIPNPRASASAEFGALCAIIGATVGAVIGLRHGKTLVYKRKSVRGYSRRTSGRQNSTMRASLADGAGGDRQAFPAKPTPPLHRPPAVFAKTRLFPIFQPINQVPASSGHPASSAA